MSVTGTIPETGTPTTPPAPEHLYLTQDEVADLLRCGPDTRDRFPKPIWLGRRLLFRADEVRAFVEQ
jgi:hypothetical protein